MSESTFKILSGAIDSSGVASEAEVIKILLDRIGVRLINSREEGFMSFYSNIAYVMFEIPQIMEMLVPNADDRSRLTQIVQSAVNTFSVIQKGGLEANLCKNAFAAAMRTMRNNR